MLILIELRPLYHFCGRVSPEKRNFWEHFPNFQVQFVPWIWHHRNMKYRNGRTYFVVISENVVNFDEAPWESAAFTNLFSRSQNEHFGSNFFSLSPCTREKNLLRFSAWTIESYLGTTQNHQELAFSEYP